MTPLAAVPVLQADSWITVLRAAIRPEFAVERYVAQPGDVLFGGAECSVPECGYPATRASGGLCFGHGAQLRRGGRSDANAWLALGSADGGPLDRRNRQGISECVVRCCERSAVSEALCAASAKVASLPPDGRRVRLVRCDDESDVSGRVPAGGKLRASELPLPASPEDRVMRSPSPAVPYPCGQRRGELQP